MRRDVYRNDYFGMYPMFLYHKDGIAAVSNKYHMLLKILKNLEVELKFCPEVSLPILAYAERGFLEQRIPIVWMWKTFGRYRLINLSGSEWMECNWLTSPFMRFCMNTRHMTKANIWQHWSLELKKLNKMLPLRFMTNGCKIIPFMFWEFVKTTYTLILADADLIVINLLDIGSLFF